MNTYFSPSRKGLFNLPVGDDAVLLTEEVAAALMVELAAGKVLDADAEGNPIAVEAPHIPTPEEEYLAKPLAERLVIQLGRLNADYDQAVAVSMSITPLLKHTRGPYKSLKPVRTKHGSTVVV